MTVQRCCRTLLQVRVAMLPHYATRHGLRASQLLIKRSGIGQRCILLPRGCSARAQTSNSARTIRCLSVSSSQHGESTGASGLTYEA